MREVEERHLRKNVLLQALPKYDSEGGRTLLPCGHGQLVYRYCQNKSILNKSHVWCGHFTFTIVRVNISSFQPSLSSLVLAPINCTKICFFCPKKQTNLPSWGQLQKWLLACYSKNRNKSFDWFSTHSTTYPLLNVLTKVMVVTLYSSVRDNLFLIVSISHVTLWLAPW